MTWSILNQLSHESCPRLDSVHYAEITNLVISSSQDLSIKNLEKAIVLAIDL